MNIDAYKWERALKLARDFKMHMDTVLAYRKRYLDRIHKEETNKEFLKAAQEVGPIVWEAIEAKEKEEKKK